MQEKFNYKEYVKECSRGFRDVMISNKSIKHAEDLITEIIHIATERICILTGSCDDKFYNKKSILEEFESFIKKTDGRGKIQIICECDDVELNDGNGCKELIRFLYNEYEKQEKPESLSLYRLKNNGVIKDVKSEHAIHFMVIDNNGPFRYEEHSIEGDRSAKIADSCGFLIEAKANFGNKAISKSLQDYFDKLKEDKYSSKMDIACTH